MRRGLDVVHADLNTGLGSFATSSSTACAQPDAPDRTSPCAGAAGDAARRPEGIVSFPNFANRSARRQLSQEGVAPVTAGLPFQWYDTPNLHFLSIKDFESFCRQFGVTIERLVALDTSTGRQVTDDPNLNADVAIFVIRR